MEAQVQPVQTAAQAERGELQNDMNLEVSLGRRLRQLRQARRMSLDALACAIGVSFQQVQKYERGMNRISVSTLIRLADALEVSVHEFLDFDVRSTRAYADAVRFLDEDDAIALVRAFVRVPAGDRRETLLKMISLMGED